MTCCRQNHTQASTAQGTCCCSFPMKGHMSKKKKIQALNVYKNELEEKVDDIKEYIKEFESA